ncbi:MAG: tetratricopeptide repeat protein [Treponema sp.]|jgi:tetratricopeptide (TPR) repeat protein|nr:tetratricopeptide repeat protein [Treponema sp.]
MDEKEGVNTLFYGNDLQRGRYPFSESSFSEQREISEWSKKGYQLLREDKVPDAIDYFSKILTIDSENNYALVGMGDANRKRGSFRDAIIFYQRCLDSHANNNYALFGLADCYKALNQHQKAIEIWEQYLLHDDKNLTVLTRVADAYRKIKDFRHSKNVYLQVLEMEENNPYAIIGLGHLHYDFKEYEVALYYWNKMLVIKDGNVDIRVLTSIGNCYRKLKTFEEGINYFKYALERDPCNFYALFGIADCYRGLNCQEQSLEYWNIILKQDPRNKVILTRAGDAYRHSYKYEMAVEYYNRALNIEFDIYAVLGLAVVARIQGRYGEAIESLQRLIQQDPHNYRFYVELAECFMANGEKSRAVNLLEGLLQGGARSKLVNDYLEMIQAV